MFRLLLLALFLALLIAGAVGPATAQPVEIGLAYDPHGPRHQALDEWQWALGSGGVRLHALDSTSPPAFTDLSNLALIVIEDVSMSMAQTRELARWVEDGGVLLVAGVRPLYAGAGGEALAEASTAINEALCDLAGVFPDFHDPGMIGAYPYLVEEDALLSPLVEGDGLRLGVQGMGHALRLRVAGDVRVLAESARLRPGPDSMVRQIAAPSMAARLHGKGMVLYVGFSPAMVAACYPDDAGRATDCSAAGTARMLMRWLIANPLWQHRGLPVVLPWETPGTYPVNVVLTGDVHLDEQGLQIRAAIRMAEIAGRHGVPVTFFVVGEVARQSSAEFELLRNFSNVEIATHSAHGERYQRKRSGFMGRRISGVHGRMAVRDDIRQAESMLDLPDWPDARSWRSAIRTEAWGSNQTVADAWTGMTEAGVGLVLDHNADKLLPRPQWTAPAKWFEGEVRKRLFIPAFEKSVSTAADDFRLPPELAGYIASLAAPESDPCCNDGVTFERYADYVRQWHTAFRRIGAVGGATEVWLWHPSTPWVKQGFAEVDALLREMRSDPHVHFLRASEVATWNFNRRQAVVRPRYSADGKLVELELDDAGDAQLPLPPGSSLASETLSFWVRGRAAVPGWEVHHREDSNGHVVTVLGRRLNLPQAPNANPGD